MGVEVSGAPNDGRAAVLDRLDELGRRFEARARDNAALRREVEDEWRAAERATAGEYDDKTLAAIRERRGSEVYMNATRTKTDAWIARLDDMLHSLTPLLPVSKRERRFMWPRPYLQYWVIRDCWRLLERPGF